MRAMAVSSQLTRLRKNISEVTNTVPMKVVLCVPPIFIVLMVGLLLWFLKALPPEVPLYYSRPWGEEQLASPFFLFVLPLGTLLWYIANLLLIGYQTYQYRVFAQILLIMQVVSTGLAGMVIITILHLVL